MPATRSPRLVASLVSRRGGSGGGSRGSQYPTHPQSHYGEAPADGATNATATTTATVRSSSALLEAINSPRPLHTAQPRSPMFTSRGAGSSPRLRHIARDGQGAGSDREADDMAAAADLYRALVGGGAKDGYAGELEREQLEGEGREQGDADFFAAVGAAASGGRCGALGSMHTGSILFLLQRRIPMEATPAELCNLRRTVAARAVSCVVLLM